MAINHAASVETIDIRPFGVTLRKAISRTLIRSDHLEVFRLVLPACNMIPDHKLPRVCQLPSVITIQCLEGAVESQAHGRTQTMQSRVTCWWAGNSLAISRGGPLALPSFLDRFRRDG